jgi:hypothetical protein
MKNQAKRHPDRFEATNSATSNSVSEGVSYGVDLTTQNGPSLTLRVMKNQAKRHPDRFKATISATSKLTLRVSVLPHFLTNRLFQQPTRDLASRFALDFS